MSGGGGAAAGHDPNKSAQFVAKCLLNPVTDFAPGDEGAGCGYVRHTPKLFKINFARDLEPVSVLHHAYNIMGALRPGTIQFGTYTERENIRADFLYKLDDDNVWSVELNYQVLECEKTSYWAWEDEMQDMLNNMDTGTGTQMRRVRDLTFIA